MSNLSEEEKKAIEFSEELHEVVKKAMEVKYRDNELKALQTIIKKQQKEIEEFYKEININTEIHKRDEKIKELEETIQCLHETDKEYISKDKIEELIKAKKRSFGSRYNLLNYDDITYEDWVKVEDVKRILEGE